jgi:NADH pyrophosphatase NudC (nudix superfamily)
MPEHRETIHEQEFPSAHTYMIVLDDKDDINYEVRASACPHCGTENTDVEIGRLRVCYKCKNKFNII